MKFKLIVLAFASLANVNFSCALASEGGRCTQGGVLFDGDASLAVISSTGSAALPCRVDSNPSLIGTTRGRTGYGVYTGGVTRSIVGGTLRLVGIAQPVINDEFHKSSIFSMELEANPAQSQVRVALVARSGATSLEVTTLNQWTGDVETLGSLPVGRRGTFELALAQNPRIAGVQLTLTSGAVATTFSLKQNLGPKGLNGWQYGLLNDTSADNTVAYTWLMANGPMPTITAN
jgi:hypothetical protein